MTKKQILKAKLSLLQANPIIQEEIQTDIHTYGLGDKNILSKLIQIYSKELNDLEPTKEKYRQMDIEECIEIEKTHAEQAAERSIPPNNKTTIEIINDSINKQK